MVAKSVKRVFVLFLVVVLCCGMLSSCGTIVKPKHTSVVGGDLIKIPDIEKLDVETAKTLFAGKGLIPKVEYEYNNDYDYDLVIRTSPDIGAEVEEDTPVTLYVCKGPAYYELSDAVGYIDDVYGIEGFVWEREALDGIGTKAFYLPWVENGEMYINIQLNCFSDYSIEFYGDFGTASIKDTFDKTVPIKIIYDNRVVNNKGETTDFTLKIPLSDLGEQQPTNIYVEFDFLVNGRREVFTAGFDLTW